MYEAGDIIPEVTDEIYHEVENEQGLRIAKCQGDGCKKGLVLSRHEKPSQSMWAHEDAYGLFTGIYCDECRAERYPYREDEYFDPSYAGERMDEEW